MEFLQDPHVVGAHVFHRRVTHGTGGGTHTSVLMTGAMNGAMAAAVIFGNGAENGAPGTVAINGTGLDDDDDQAARLRRTASSVAIGAGTRARGSAPRGSNAGRRKAPRKSITRGSRRTSGAVGGRWQRMAERRRRQRPSSESSSGEAGPGQHATTLVRSAADLRRMQTTQQGGGGHGAVHFPAIASTAKILHTKSLRIIAKRKEKEGAIGWVLSLRFVGS